MTSSLGAASGSDVSGITSTLESLVPQFSQYASQASALEPNFLDLASTEGTDAGNIYGPAFSQYTAGAGGTITPAQQAAVDQTLKQQNLQTAGTYGNLGLGGSTMQTQDTNANAAKSLAQTQAFSTLDETLGLSGLDAALKYYTGDLSALTGALGTQTGAGQILSGATGALSNAGNIATTEQQTQLGLLGSLGSAIGGSSGIFGSGGLFSSTGALGGLFGGGGGAGAGLSAADILGTTGAIF